MNNKRVAVILTAGRGTRMDEYCETLNKALLPINGKAVISHIIEKFPSNTEFVVGLGHFADQVRHYLSIAHPHTEFKFVEIDNYEGEGSGPGYSLMQCRDFLQQAFYFVSCDTLWENQIDWEDNSNWLGASSRFSLKASGNYLNLKIQDRKVVELRDKEKIENKIYSAFVGLCHIYDFKIFWESLEKSTIKAGEHQISNGLQALVDRGLIYAKEIEWTDVGDKEKYKKVVSRYENYDFSKLNESLYFSNNRVIKRFANQTITDKRVLKAKLNPDVFPDIIYHQGEFYAYDFQPGETLYQHNNTHIFSKLLQWLKSNLWKNMDVSSEIFKKACKSFYKDKTLERLRMYNEKYDNAKNILIINGENIPSAEDLLTDVSWENLTGGIPVFFHGDLQFDNILYIEEQDTFKLLDWRQDFAGHVEFGDIYYDLAKLYGGIILNYDLIKMNFLQYEEYGDCILFDFAQRYQTQNYLQILNDFILQNGYSLANIKLLVGLIYLNMAPLHHYPFDKMLHALSRKILSNELQ